MNLVGSHSSPELDTLPDHANIIIVGGGLVGLEVAKELDIFGVTGVLVLEAGPTGDLLHINAAHDAETALLLWLDPNTDKYFWRPWTSKSPPHFSGAAGLKRRLGGRSLCWHGVILPIESRALCEPWWPRALIDDLTVSWRGGPSLYARVSAELERWRTSVNSPSFDLDVPALTIGRYKFHKTPQATRNIVSNNGQLWEAYTPLSYWSRDEGNRVLYRSTSTLILPEVEVIGVKIVSGRATGVIVQSRSSRISKEIKCNAVVLAAGTIENTRLAIQALSTTGAIKDTQLNGLVDHIVQGFVVTIDPACLPNDLADIGNPERFYFTHCADHSSSNLFVRMTKNLTGAFVIDAWTMGEQLPSTRGVVQCVPEGDQPWEVFVQTSLTESDWEVIKAQRDELQSFWTAFCGIINHPLSLLEFPDFNDPTRTLIDVLPGLESAPSGTGPITWSGPLGSEYHEGSTLPIGVLLNEEHEFVHIKSLFAGGPSTFPRLGAANPSMTSLALAKRLAAFLPG